MTVGSRVLFLVLAALPSAFAAVPPVPVPYQVPCALPDQISAVEPTQVQLHGWLGERIDANIGRRLEVVDTVPLLAGYHHKPGEQAWIGEHVGKWLHAATFAWAYTGDPDLRRKLDAVAAELISTQEPDGYLGTYLPGQRFGLYPGADWDVWNHAYNMIGLTTYYRYSGNTAALAAVRRIADLLIATFPGQKSIVAAGTHRGMAATSVLEPVVELYRLTAEPRYLAFARYIVAAYDEPGGPGIVRALLANGEVNKTANGKAYEMLANLMGVCDLARVTGDRSLLRAVTNAWTDIVRNRLYITGTASLHEHFGGDADLPNGVDAQLGETCVTTTWIQLNLQLLQVTGRPAYADEIDRSLYNHLAAAQNPRGDDWCYYTALEGKKQYDRGITCCHSSGPRAFALAPTAAYLQGGSTLCVSTFESSQARFEVGGQSVGIEQSSGFPRDGRSTLVVHAAQPATFSLRIRVPPWAAPLRIGNESFAAGWAEVPARQWRDGERLDFSYELAGRSIAGSHGDLGRTAYAWGPFILAVDSRRNAPLGSLAELRLAPNPPRLKSSRSGPLLLELPAGSTGPASRAITLVPFADAGADGGEYRVWLRTDS